MFKIIVDADACPVKPEVYRVARRYGLKVVLVANSNISFPPEDWIDIKVVGSALDAADDWIVDNLAASDIVITGDIPLASRAIKKRARVLSPHGTLFTECSIGNALSTRDLMTHLRDSGLVTGGPAAFAKKDRSRFLQALDSLIQSISRG